jgi:asparagine synthase (glutamine-hydrolysing)
MCGICGIHGPRQRADLEAAARRMVGTMTHRGPDAGGVFAEEGVAFGHRRLSILDLSPTGAQPMRLDGSGLAITHNGEVYNFKELRKELEADGAVFRGHSDTEVVLNVYQAWGLDGLKRLEGIFAFALWDDVARRLVLMRDRLGVKPLFFSQTSEQLVFASEIKAILAAGSVDRSIDPQAFSEYLWYGNAFEDRTIYAGVRALPPGHWMIVENGRSRIEPWWRIEEWADLPGVRDPGEAAEAVRAALDAAVARQLVADVPVGIFLSGGVDSSAIAASAMAVQDRPLTSYAVGFDFDRGINELPKARKVADHLGLDHHEFHVGGSNLEDVLVELVRAHDEPFGDAANIPLYLLAKELGGERKVVLQGDGGDEMFGGYRRYVVLHYVKRWRAWPRPLTPLAHALGSPGRRFARMATATGAGDPAMTMALLLTMETQRDPPTRFMTAEARSALDASADPFLAYRRAATRFQGGGAVQRMLLTDLTLQLPSQFLPKVDRATMARGLEARVPFLDERVGELATGLPAEWKVDGRQRKIILRDAMRSRLPAAILDGPKTGFGVPYEYWLRTSLFDMARAAILDPGFVTAFGFDATAVGSALTEHRSGARDHGFFLWKVFQLALWRQEQRA